MPTKYRQIYDYKIYESNVIKKFPEYYVKNKNWLVLMVMWPKERPFYQLHGSALLLLSIMMFREINWLKGS